MVSLDTFIKMINVGFFLLKYEQCVLVYERQFNLHLILYERKTRLFICPFMRYKNEIIKKWFVFLGIISVSKYLTVFLIRQKFKSSSVLYQKKKHYDTYW